MPALACQAFYGCSCAPSSNLCLVGEAAYAASLVLHAGLQVLLASVGLRLPLLECAAVELPGRWLSPVELCAAFAACYRMTAWRRSLVAAADYCVGHFTSYCVGWGSGGSLYRVL